MQYWNIPLLYKQINCFQIYSKTDIKYKIGKEKILKLYQKYFSVCYDLATCKNHMEQKCFQFKEVSQLEFLTFFLCVLTE